MNEKEKLIEEAKKQIEILKQEIRDKELVLSNLIEELDNIENQEYVEDE